MQPDKEIKQVKFFCSKKMMRWVRLHMSSFFMLSYTGAGPGNKCSSLANKEALEANRM